MGFFKKMFGGEGPKNGPKPIDRAPEFDELLANEGVADHMESAPKGGASAPEAKEGPRLSLREIGQQRKEQTKSAVSKGASKIGEKLGGLFGFMKKAGSATADYGLAMTTSLEPYKRAASATAEGGKVFGEALKFMATEVAPEAGRRALEGTKSAAKAVGRGTAEVAKTVGKGVKEAGIQAIAEVAVVTLKGVVPVVEFLENRTQDCRNLYGAFRNKMDARRERIAEEKRAAEYQRLQTEANASDARMGQMQEQMEAEMRKRQGLREAMAQLEALEPQPEPEEQMGAVAA